MEELTDVLRREESLLERLLFKLVQTRLLLTAAEVRFVPTSTREATRARASACGADLARAALVDGLTGPNGGSAAATLRELASAAPEPWAGMLRDHHQNLCSLVAEIEVTAHVNGRLAREGLDELQHRLADTDTDTEPNSGGDDDRDRDADRDDGARPALRSPRNGEDADPTLLFVADHSAYRSVLGKADGLRMPDLLAFLR